MEETCWFASGSFWLPEGVEWSDLHWESNFYLQAVSWMALAFLLLRRFVESLIARCCVGVDGLSDKPLCPAPPHNSVLEVEFLKNSSPGPQLEESLAEQLGWSKYHVHRWFWRARNWKKPSTLTKFTESCWRLLFYSAVFSYGIVHLSQQDFFWDIKKCYLGYPKRHLPSPVLTYWSLQVAFYCSMIITQFTDIRRKDFIQCMIHHGVCVALLLACYFVHHVQVGCLIVFSHDGSDVLLELAKILKYAKKEQMATVVFVLFAVVFFATRLVIFPFWLIYSVVFDLPVYSGPFPALKYLVLLLLILQALHVYWFKLILSMVYRGVKGEEMSDARSGSELSSDEEGKEKKEN